MKLLRDSLLPFVLVLLFVSQTFADIEKPVKGKRYKLGSNHGPWMIMVAAIRDVDDETRRINGGMTAWQAADEIVFALRSKGIPAYTYSLEEKIGNISSPSLSNSGERRYVAQHGYVSVMAGNFPSNDDPKAKQCIEYIKKKFDPEFLSDPENGGILPRTPGRPSVFSRAFMTINPLYEGEVRDNERDSFIAELNAGQKYSLLQNKGRYSLVVATFLGGSVMQVGNESSNRALGFFEKHFGKGLDECAENSILLTDKLRNAKKYGYDENFEAYVFHDRHKSVVTIGSFESADDPRIRTLATKFGGKVVRHPQTGEDVLAGEAFTVPRVTKNNQPPAYSWIFDAQPRIMAVPRTR